MSAASIYELIQRGDWANAESQATETLASQPTNARVHAYLGLCRFHRMDFESAAQSFRTATFLDPQYWQAGAKLAQCYERLHRLEEGLEVCQEFIRVQPADHTLQGLLEYFQDRAKVRQEGWERTAHLAHEVTMANES